MLLLLLRLPRRGVVGLSSFFSRVLVCDEVSSLRVNKNEEKKVLEGKRGNVLRARIPVLTWRQGWCHVNARRWSPIWSVLSPAQVLPLKGGHISWD